jgi:SAM-dependent methyltransferase
MTTARSVPPAALFERALRGGALYVRGEDGKRLPVPLQRWLGPPSAADARVLDRAGGPVLDVGCGPGRHVLALARRGVFAIGVDIAPGAVQQARDRGATAILGSIFDPVPGARRWQTALLLDGNIGIGGRPAALLARVCELLRPAGTVLCELGPPGCPSRAELVALEDGGGVRSSWFPWARLGVDAVQGTAERAGFALEEAWEDDGRWFARLTATTSIAAQPAVRRRAA